MRNIRLAGDLRRDNFHVTSLLGYRYIAVMSYRCFTQPSVWDNPGTFVWHPYDLSRLISLATRLFVHVLLLFDNKGNPKPSLTFHFFGVSTDDLEILSSKSG